MKVLHECTKYIAVLSVIFLVACHSSGTHTEKVKVDTIAYDSIRFGNIQPLLERNVAGEKIVRVDSMIDFFNKAVFYYTTDKGSRTYTHNGVFKETVLAAYKPDGSRDCFEKASLADGAWRTKCDTRGCTLVLDTDRVQHPSGPYPLQPGADTSSKPCSTVDTSNKRL